MSGYPTRRPSENNLEAPLIQTQLLHWTVWPRQKKQKDIKRNSSILASLGHESRQDSREQQLRRDPRITRQLSEEGYPSFSVPQIHPQITQIFAD